MKGKKCDYDNKSGSKLQELCMSIYMHVSKFKMSNFN